MLRPGVQLQLAKLRAGDAVARHHPPHRVPDDLLGARVEQLLERALLEPAVIARVAVVDLVAELLARDAHALAVHHHDEVAGVDVRRVLRLSLAAQRLGDARRKSAERLAVGVDDEPGALDLARLGVVGLRGHDSRLSRQRTRGGRRFWPRAKRPGRPGQARGMVAHLYGTSGTKRTSSRSSRATRPPSSRRSRT